MEAISCSVNEAAKAVGIGRVTLYKLINEGRVEAVKVGGRTLIRIASIHRLIDSAQRIAA